MAEIASPSHDQEKPKITAYKKQSRLYPDVLTAWRVFFIPLNISIPNYQLLKFQQDHILQMSS